MNKNLIPPNPSLVNGGRGDFQRKYFHRNLIDELKKWLDRREILAIKGPRQSGKTTLLYIIKDYLVNTKKVVEENII